MLTCDDDYRKPLVTAAMTAWFNGFCRVRVSLLEFSSFISDKLITVR